MSRYKIVIGGGLGKSEGKVIRYHRKKYIAVAVNKINIEPPFEQQSEKIGLSMRKERMRGYVEIALVNQDIKKSCNN